MADEPVVVPRSTPAATTPPPAEDFEAKARAYVRDRYGIEDDPDAFKTKHRTVTERASQAEHWERTAQQMARVAQAYQGQSQVQRQPQPQPQQPDPSQLRELWRIDPYEGWTRAHNELMGQFQTLLARHAQGVDRLTQERANQQQAAASWNAKLGEEYPEAWEPGHDLHKLGRRIFEGWSPQRQAEPDAAYVAASMAAAQLGLAPKARRRAPQEPVEDEVAAQNAERGSRRPSPTRDPNDPPKLTDEERRMAKAANIDPKVMAQMKQARAGKKNVRSE